MDSFLSGWVPYCINTVATAIRNPSNNFVLSILWKYVVIFSIWEDIDRVSGVSFRSDFVSNVESAWADVSWHGVWNAAALKLFLLKFLSLLSSLVVDLFGRMNKEEGKMEQKKYEREDRGKTRGGGLVGEGRWFGGWVCPNFAEGEQGILHGTFPPKFLPASLFSRRDQHPPPLPVLNNNAIAALQSSADASLTPSQPSCSRAVALLQFSASTKRRPHHSDRAPVSFANVYTRKAAVPCDGCKTYRASNPFLIANALGFACAATLSATSLAMCSGEHKASTSTPATKLKTTRPNRDIIDPLHKPEHIAAWPFPQEVIRHDTYQGVTLNNSKLIQINPNKEQLSDPDVFYKHQVGVCSKIGKKMAKSWCGGFSCTSTKG
jgi:hypothetical protein